MPGDETINVLMAGYFSRKAAEDDAAAVEALSDKVIGLAVVSKDLEGNVAVDQHTNAARRGATMLGGAGLVVGLFAPPLLAATAIGAALGAGVGKVVERKVASQIQEEANASIPIGGAGLIVAFPLGSRLAVENAVRRSITRVVGEGHGSRSSALQAAIVDAQESMAAAGH